MTTIEATPGSTLFDTYKKCKSMATVMEPVHLIFNDIGATVYHDSCFYDIADKIELKRLLIYNGIKDI
jgi:hypothetical protein